MPNDPTDPTSPNYDPSLDPTAQATGGPSPQAGGMNRYMPAIAGGIKGFSGSQGQQSQLQPYSQAGKGLGQLAGTYMNRPKPVQGMSQGQFGQAMQGVGGGMPPNTQPGAIDPMSGVDAAAGAGDAVDMASEMPAMARGGKVAPRYQCMADGGTVQNNQDSLGQGQRQAQTASQDSLSQAAQQNYARYSDVRAMADGGQVMGGGGWGGRSSPFSTQQPGAPQSQAIQGGTTPNMQTQPMMPMDGMQQPQQGGGWGQGMGPQGWQNGGQGAYGQPGGGYQPPQQQGMGPMGWQGRPQGGQDQGMIQGRGGMIGQYGMSTPNIPTAATSMAQTGNPASPQPAYNPYQGANQAGAAGMSNQQIQQQYQNASGQAFAKGGVVLGPREPQQELGTPGTTITEPGAAMRRYDPISPSGPKAMFGPKPEEMAHHLPTKLRLGSRLNVRLPRPTSKVKGLGGVKAPGKI